MPPLMRSPARSWRDWSWRPAPLLSALALGGWLMGCSPHIGSSCNLSTDCSSQGDRVCDTAQPGGYCTILNCNSFSCPDHAVCVLFESTVPGCDPHAAYSDYQQPSRTGVPFCMQHCGSDGDCRGGYVCRDPRQAPWNASIVSDDQNLRVCVSAPNAEPMEDAPSTPVDGSLCVGVQPPLVSSMDAAPDAVSDGASDAGDSAAEADAAGPDAAGDGATDATLEDALPEAGDGAFLDGTDDVSTDTGAADGPTGG